MDRSMLVGSVLGAVAVTAGGAFATYQVLEANRQPQFAEVVAVEPIKRVVETPREVCRDVTVTHQRPVQDEYKVAGTAIGAIAGGLLGSQIGGGTGKKIATVAGAAAGGYAGNQAQGELQRRDTYTTTETRCNTVTDRHEEVSGYTVTYRLNGQTGQVEMDRDPGAAIPVREGQLVLSAPQ